MRRGPGSFRPRVGPLLARARLELVPTRSVEEQFPHLPTGATVTVVSSPRRGLEPTLHLCELLTGEGFRAVPHISARLVASRKHLGEILDRLSGAGIREVFVVGGDSPEPAGPFGSALALLSAMAELDGRFEAVGVAGYPEGHPLIEERALLRALLDKQRLASYLVTQICYDPQAVVAWISRIRRAGVRLPVLIGTPGVVSRAKLLEISLRVGVGDSIRYLRKHGGLVRRLIGRGGWHPRGFVATVSSLLDPGAPDVVGFHINTFNQVERTERWRREALARSGWADRTATT